MENGDVIYRMRSNYHWDCHDGGIGDNDGAVHPVTVHWREHDKELSHLEALKFIEACFVQLVHHALLIPHCV